MCLLLDRSMLFFILSAFTQKQAQRVVWEGSKIFFWFFYKNEPYTLLLFCRGSNKVKGFFLCQSPVAALPGCRRTYEGWHEGRQSIWIMSVVFGASFLFDMIAEIPAWSCKTGNYGKKLLPTHIQNWTSDFVKLIVDNHCMPNSSYGALRKPCGRSTSVFCGYISCCGFGFWYKWNSVCDRCAVNS